MLDDKDMGECGMGPMGEADTDPAVGGGEDMGMDDMDMGGAPDMGGDDLGGDMGDDSMVGDMDDMGMGDDMMGDDMGMGGEPVSVDKETLRGLFDQVASGELSVEDAISQCCGDAGGMDDMGMGDDMGMDAGMDDMGGGDDLSMAGELDGGADAAVDMGGGEDDMPPMENIVRRVADMITDDPDIFAGD
jgi:hypothetical protein